jgi:hypothetical protein
MTPQNALIRARQVLTAIAPELCVPVIPPPESSDGLLGLAASAAIIVDAAKLFEKYNSDDAFRAVVGITLHEAAHFLGRGQLCVPVGGVPQPELEYRAAAERDENREPRDEWAAVLTHGFKFTRAAVHLWYRASALSVLK